MLISCSAGKEITTAEEAPATTDRTSTSGQTEINLIEDEILPEMPISGIAQNLKGGATVESEGVRFWIDGLDSWEDALVNKAVTVWGKIEIRYDAPVFMDTSEIKSQGIPVYSEEEMKEQSKRYWIINAVYKLSHR